MLDLSKGLDIILDIIPIPVVGWDRRSSIIFWNHKATSEFGWEGDEVLGKSLEEVLGKGFKKEVEEVERDLKNSDITILHRNKITTKEGNKKACEWTSVFFSSNSHEIHCISMAKDVSKIELMQKKMIESQRLASMGQHLGSVCHEINNLLVGIIGYLSIAKVETQGRKTQEEVLSALNIARRVKALTANLLSHTRNGREGEGKCSLNRVITEVVEFSKKILPEGITLSTTYPDNGLIVNADENILYNILLNLIMNARDSIKEEGFISISLDKIDNSDVQISVLSRKKFVIISITDTGSGIPEAIKNRIFEPFFTTKEHSGGTGLGLYIVYNSIRKLGGWINVDTEEGKGSTFTIYLPLVA